MNDQLAYPKSAEGGADALQSHNLSPAPMRAAEVDLAVLATQQALRALHGIHVVNAAAATAAGSAVENPVQYVEQGAFEQPQIVIQNEA